jgi:hypothetical protein
MMFPPTSQTNGAFDHSLAERGLHGPAYRWQTAEELPPCRFNPLVLRQDLQVRAAHHFMQLAKRGTAGATYAAAMYPEIAAALLLDQEKAKVDRLKIGVFGDLTWEEIASSTGVDVGLVKTWSSLFYDASDTRKAIGWVANRIVQPELDAGNVELAAKLKLVAAVGPIGARAILALDSKIPVTAGEHLFRRKLQLSLKFDQALDMAVGPQDAFRFVKLHANLKMQEKRLEHAERKLAEGCNEALRKHELAKVRLEIALEREKNRHTSREAHEAETLILEQLGEQYEAELAAERLDAFDRAEQEEAAARAAVSPLAEHHWPSRQPPLDESHPHLRVVVPNDTAPAAERACVVPFTEDNRSTADLTVAAVSA